MAKFNEKSKGTKTMNVAGGAAFKESAELELVSLMLTSFVNDRYYESAHDSLKRLELLIGEVDPKFAAQATVYARQEFGMRSISHAAVVDIVWGASGSDWTRSFVYNAIHRVDDMTEIMARHISKYGKRPIPNALKVGLARAFDKFDDYQLRKYRGERKAVSLIDLVNLVHPKPTERNAKALAELVSGKSKGAETWEVKLTQAGQQATSKEEKVKLKAEAWKSLLENRRIGYFALLRNLRNILQQAPELVELACELLVDERLIKKSLVMPFRYMVAHDVLMKEKGASKILPALNKALEISCANVPKLPGKTVVLMDDSGSMTWRGRLNGKDSSYSAADIAATFSAILLKTQPDADLIMFSSNARYKSLNTDDSILTMTAIINASKTGADTNFQVPFQVMGDTKYDRIIILSDMQGWMGGGYGCPVKSFAEYRERSGADPILYSWDLCDYGTMMFPERNVYALAGFNSEVFSIMELLEQDKQALVNKIKDVDLTS